MRTIKYEMSNIYEGKLHSDGFFVTIPEFEGRKFDSPCYKTLQEWDDFLYDDEYLDTIHFRFEVEFMPYDTNTFSTFKIIKIGGCGETAHGDEYYETFTREEADFIISSVIDILLGINIFDLKTDSKCFIYANAVDDDWDDEEEDW